MHNGGIGGFKGLRRHLLELLPDKIWDSIDGSTDSEHAFALFLHLLFDRSPSRVSTKTSVVDEELSPSASEDSDGEQDGMTPFEGWKAAIDEIRHEKQVNTRPRGASWYKMPIDLQEGYSASDIRSALRRTYKVISDLQDEHGTSASDRKASMNFCITDGRTLIATRCRRPIGEDAPSLYYAIGSDFSYDPKDEQTHIGHGAGTKVCIIASEPLSKVVDDWTVPSYMYLPLTCTCL